MLLPGELRVVDVQRPPPGDVDRFRRPVDQQVDPLVEHHQRPVAVRNPGERHVPVLVALGERERGAIGVAQGAVTGGVRQSLVIEPVAQRKHRTVVQRLVGRTRHVQVRHVHVDRVAAMAGAETGTQTRLASVDDRRVGHPHEHVPAARSELLEVGWLAGPHERIQQVGTVQRVGLQPFLAGGRARRARMHGDSEPPRHQVPDDRLADQRRGRLAVRLELRADDDHAHGNLIVLVGRRDRARVQARQRVDRAIQRIGQRQVEHVVGHLSGRIAGRAGVVPQNDLEAAQAGLDRSVAVVLAIDREVILEHEDGQRGRLHRVCLRVHGDRRKSARPGGSTGRRRNRRAGRRVPATGRCLARRRRAAGAVGRYGRIGCVAGVERVRRVAGQDRKVIACRRTIGVGGIQHGLIRGRRGSIRARGSRNADPAGVAYRRYVRCGGRVVDALAALAALRTGAAAGDHRHVAGVEVGAERRRHAGRAGRWLGAARAVLLAIRIQVEGQILFDHPLVVGDRGLRVRVPDRDAQAAGRREIQRDGGRRCARRALRVDRVVRERAGTCRGGGQRRQGRGERAVGLQRDRAAAARACSRQCGERIAVRVGVVQQHAGGADLQQAGAVAGVRVGVRHRRAADPRCVERDGGRHRRVAVTAVTERSGRAVRETGRHGQRESAVRIQRDGARRAGRNRLRPGRTGGRNARARRVVDPEVVGQHIAGERGRVGRHDVVVGDRRGRCERVQHAAGGVAGAGSCGAAIDHQERLHPAVALGGVGRKAQLAVE